MLSSEEDNKEQRFVEGLSYLAYNFIDLATYVNNKWRIDSSSTGNMEAVLRRKVRS